LPRLARVDYDAPQVRIPQEGLSFVHLSDLHINERGVGNPNDFDFDIRAQVEIDLSDMKALYGPWTGILVSGDVAASGKQDEYAKAADWFGRLTDLLGCPTEDVWTVPGNHDVDWDTEATLPDLVRWHADLRACLLQDVDTTLLAAMNSGAQGLLGPLHNYVRFATRYGCPINPAKPFWTDDLSLNDGSVLRLHGLTSPLISGRSPKDDTGANKLVLGTAQAQVSTGQGVTGLLLCHHPLDWMRDADACRNYFDSRATVQLFGHKHSHRLDRVNNTMHVEAGALHPERTGVVWEPRYNLITLRVANTEAGRFLSVDIRPRRWHRLDTRFGPDHDIRGGEVRHEDIPLGTWQPPATIDHPEPEVIAVANAPEDAYGEGGAPLMNRERRLAYRFAQLPRLVQLRIGAHLNLVEENEHKLRTQDLVALVLNRALATHTTAHLWEEVEARYADRTPGPNPFAEEKK